MNTRIYHLGNGTARVTSDDGSEEIVRVVFSKGTRVMIRNPYNRDKRVYKVVGIVTAEDPLYPGDPQPGYIVTFNEAFREFDGENWCSFFPWDLKEVD